MGVRTEEIRGSIAYMGEEALADALALLLGEGQERLSADAAGIPEFENFAQVIHYLKKNYGFTELALFSTEADLVYVSTDERRILLTDRDSQIHSAIKKSGTIPDTREKPSALPVDSDENNDTSKHGESGRFSHLEL